jgi:hypothetical protein
MRSPTSIQVVLALLCGGGALLGAIASCARKGPAQSSPDAAPAASETAPAPCASSAPSGSSATSVAPPGSASAAPAGEASPVFSDKRIYSLALQTYVRAVPSLRGRVLGYLRVGDAALRSDDPVGTDGCKAGWYAVKPEGYVCNGDNATLDPGARMLAYARPAARGKPLPYVYAAVKAQVPFYYARLPKLEDMRRIEGADVTQSIAAAKASPDPNLALLGDAIEAPQALLDGDRIPRPPGTEPRFRFKFHTGRAEPKTRLALQSWFEAEGRRFAISSQLDLIALDRVRLIQPSAFHGIELGDDEGLPVGFVRGASTTGYRFADDGKVSETVRLNHGVALRLTGKEKKHAGSRLLESSDGTWVADASLVVVEPRDKPPTFVDSDDIKWIDIHIRNQSLIAYRGKKPVYVTLVSTGTGNMGDPETTHATPRGLFSIFSKHVSTRMSGDEIGAEYLIDDVPYVQYFHKSYALHGAFWHDDFGHVHSHGCVNLAPIDAAWMFEFTSPQVPADWHGVFVRSGGTVVLIGP